MPYEVWEREILETADAFKAKHPDLGAIVLECTNLTPFTAQISEVLQMPVYDRDASVLIPGPSARPTRWDAIGQ
ncbi:hypothetical protein DPM13_12670 [Paracoccus mutanolyticus]|uniref:Aspartate racemase n=1 Tax=Paracoccus mutanolyticus TaxID=1499308 RepID=A0ABM6WSG2_9RHOB|nr:hypothetical protein [Paracoccus mutanolyticus]AWX93642.1 hypothetical protein DPM13_12670 [Paracoccus mutanolyticus]